MGGSIVYKHPLRRVCRKAVTPYPLAGLSQLAENQICNLDVTGSSPVSGYMWKIQNIVSSGRYLKALVPEHPHANKHGYVLLHRIIVENHFNILLNEEQLVHHKDNNSRNNQISNLEIVSHSEHMELHSKGITTVTLICPVCKEEFIRERRHTHLIKGGTSTCCSRFCGRMKVVLCIS